MLVRLRLIGDVVFTTPVIRAVKRRFPAARLTYLVEAASAPVVRHNPHIDDLVIVERPRGWRRLRYDWNLARRLRRQRFDVAIDLHGGPRAAWLTRGSAAPVRIGYDLPGRRWAYTARIAWTASLVPPRHSVLNQWDLLAPLGIGPADPALDPVEMPLTPDAIERVDKRLRDAGVAADARLAILHVSAGNPFRRWPADRFAALAAALASDAQPLRVVITSGPSEADAASRVALEARRLAADDGTRIVRIGEFDLEELAALITRARLYIGGDSGPLHIAATTPTPVVALFGPTLPPRSLPWRDPALPSIGVEVGPLPCRPCHQRRCVPGDFRCLTGITVPMVLAACRQALTAPPRP
ncbi:MAG: putative lipopolysaccharide heptosyltransferase III [Acidobacteria bacterium]|nr:putative lipopolysaccharide heptosyltransferase III [Acidobacteriota bacterium]HQZ39732.1 putative lipopolysaccharide heptosyltransferase III [Vicinamibacterales bacterium]